MKVINSVCCLHRTFPTGDKSEVLDVDTPDLDRFPDFVKARRYECVLNPGDLLFIPGKKASTSSILHQKTTMA